MGQLQYVQEMNMIDTHSHIYGPEFAEDRDEVVSRAKEVGVTQVLLPNINEQTIPDMLSLCSAYPGYCFPMMGLHPTDLEDDYREVLSRMQKLLLEPNHPYVAVGEVGLDFYWDDSRRSQQLEAFETQIEWARTLHLPLMIHSRSAHRELVDIMNRYRSDGLTGVFHCFGGSAEEALELLSFDGFMLGIGGVLTYKKSTLPEVLKQVPLQRIVLETDSPYLAPTPHRGTRNESSYVQFVAKKLAEVYGASMEEIVKTTTCNAQSIFPRIKCKTEGK